MEFVSTEVADCRVVKVSPMADERGTFARAWCADEFTEAGLDGTIAQMNVSTNHRAGTIRGLHVQDEPHAEAKLFRCIRGRSFHVCVDVRPGSPTLGRWVGHLLDPVGLEAFYIPRGCAAGYQALDDETTVLYATSTPYTPGVERGLRYDDPAIGIEWPIVDGIIVSEKDRSWPDVDLSGG